MAYQTINVPARRTPFIDGDGYDADYKDADSVLDYVFDWADWLGSDTISTSTWTTSGVSITSSSNTTTTATAFVSGSDGSVTNKIVTAGGRTQYRTLKLYDRARM